jgi:imidazolonepropionase-like amidohydrolase
VGADKRTGSIAVGKEADLLLVDGDVEVNIGALRQVDAVILDGIYLDGDELRREAGFSGRPK